MKKEVNKKYSAIAFPAIFVLGFLMIISIGLLFQWGDWANLPANLLVLIVLNLNIILLLILIVLVLRNLIKLYFERKKNVIGARFRTKLVFAFVSLSLVPAILLFVLASNFISKSIESWFNVHNEEYLKRSLNIAQVHYTSSIGQAFSSARLMGEEIVSKRLLDINDINKREQLRAMAARYQAAANLGTVKVLDRYGSEIISVQNTSIQKDRFSGPLNELIEKGLKGEEYSIIQRSDEGHLIEAAVPLYAEDNNMREICGVVLFNYYDPSGLMDEISYIKDAFEEYQRRKVFKKPLKMTYLITFLLMTLLIIFSATWFGFYFAKGITIPIQKLAEGTKEVASGNLDFKVESDAKDEIGMLVNSFNQMTKDLNKALTGLRQSNLELDKRRRHIEVVLANITSGVVTLDVNGFITTINPAAEKILSLKADQILFHHYYEIMRGNMYKTFKDIIDKIINGERGDIYQRKVLINIHGRIKTLLISIIRLHIQEENMGSLIVFDDLMQLIKAQKIATWQEVARRLAHETKNPLTPIQLSAQRLWKRFQGLRGEDREILKECTDTIIEESQGLKTLIDEFAQFARMPEPKMKPDDLDSIVLQTITLYRQIHPDCVIELKNGSPIPPVMIDRGQIKRVLINLMDNAYEAMIEDRKILVQTSFDSRDGMAHVLVIDWGTGISPEDKERLSEPYFSRKKGGTGLGLAIVNRIIMDHHGQLMIEDNQPKGTRVSISIPQA
ncbi:HAMP domain-containing protein [bacterium]|nr:HAMP domain-containing protein [bacterium]